MVVGVTSLDSDQAIAFDRRAMLKRARKVRYAYSEEHRLDSHHEICNG